MVSNSHLVPGTRRRRRRQAPRVGVVLVLVLGRGADRPGRCGGHGPIRPASPAAQVTDIAEACGDRARMTHSAARDGLAF